MVAGAYPFVRVKERNLEVAAVGTNGVARSIGVMFEAPVRDRLLLRVDCCGCGVAHEAGLVCRGVAFDEVDIRVVEAAGYGAGHLALVDYGVGVVWHRPRLRALSGSGNCPSVPKKRVVAVP